MRSVLKKFEKKFCAIDTGKWCLYGYIQKVGWSTVEFRYYNNDGEFMETIFISINDVKAVTSGGPAFDKFCCKVSLKATIRAEENNEDIKSKNDCSSILSKLKLITSRTFSGWFPFTKK